MNDSKNIISYSKEALLRNGVPWFPVMGEFHYSRYPAGMWEEELCKMKAGGIDIVSSYIFWIHHEEEEGKYDFSGNRDLRGFLHAAKSAGLLAFLRIGPWCHGEVRNGGLPDWVMHKEYEVRSNDTAYLQDVKAYFSKLGETIRGLTWEDGGPVLGIQIENEYGCCGGLTGEEGEKHMRYLTDMAVNAGLKAPLMTAIAWGGACTGGLLPVMGGYCDAPWAREIEKLPPNVNYVFTPERNDANIGSDFGKKETAGKKEEFPYLMAELGGGLQPTKHRRPVASAADIGAMSLVKLGCGANLLGYYMYHGGSNPEGRNTTLQETKKTGSWNELPAYNYDFQAPVGEYGQVRESCREIKLLSMFLHDFGSGLCTMKPEFPSPVMDDAGNLETLRTCVRRNGERGYLFVNNYQRLYPMKEHRNAVLHVKTGTNELCYPARDIRNGDYFFYPFNMPIGESAEIVTALATPLCILHRRNEKIYVFYSDTEPMYRIKGDLGRNKIVTLSRREALDAWKVEINGEEYLLITGGEIREQKGQIILRGIVDEENRKTEFASCPALPESPAGFKKIREEKLAYYERKEKKERTKVFWKQGRLEKGFREYELSVEYPQESMQECYLRVDYEGDSAELRIGDNVYADHFYTGQVWEIGMKRYHFPVSAKLRIHPLKESAPVYLERQPVMENGRAQRLKNIAVKEACEYVLWERKEESHFLAPFQGQEMTDIALHFKWTKKAGSEAVEYVLELADNQEFVNAQEMEATILSDSEVGYYFPKTEELPYYEGIWHARVREKNGGSWSRPVSFYINKKHGKKPVKREINRENPWFTIFDYSEHDPAEVWMLLPEELKPYTGMGLIASYKARADRVIDYMLDEDAKGYLWHLGALGPHETQFGKYTITSLSEIEYVIQHSRNLVSIGFVEQYLGTKEEGYWRNEYFFRLLALCAKYGIVFIYSDGNRNNLELAAMIKRPFFMNKMREYADYFIFSYKQNHAHAAYSCFGALLGAWIDGACSQIGVQPENWYWNDAGFRDKPGECYGYLQGNEQQITACMTVEMLLTGLSLGAVNYSCEGESWLIERGPQDKLIWSAQGLAVISFFRAVILYKLIPDKTEIQKKIRAAVDYEGFMPEALGDAWTGGILREAFMPGYRIQNQFELFPKESRFYYLPLVTDRQQAFAGMAKLYAGSVSSMEAYEALCRHYPSEAEGNAYYAVFQELMVIMHSQENEEEAQWFSIPGKDGFLLQIRGALSLWQYIIVRSHKTGCYIHVNSERGKNIRFSLRLASRPVWSSNSENISLVWKDGWLEAVVKGDGLPVEFTVADRQEEMAALVPQYHNKEEKKLQLLSELPWTYAETSQNCPVQKNACANTVYGRLPLAVGHLRYRYGLSMGNHTRIVWKLNGKYRRLSFGYGFDIDAWMPKILDRDNILWDRAEKTICMRLQLIGDGRKLFSSPRLTGTGGTYIGETDLTDVNRLELIVDGEVFSEDPGAGVYLDFLNPVLA